MKMLPRSLYIITVCICVLGMCGCARYIERETPAGVTSAAPAVQPIPGAQNSQAPAGATQAAPSASSYSPYIGRPLSGAVQPVTEELYQASIARFRQAYEKAKSPRIAVYFNKALSDEVREWATPSRSVVTGTGEKISVGGGPTVVTPEGTVIETGGGTSAEGTADAERGVTTYTQQHTEDAQRQKPDEVWMWRFEDNFLQPFLKAGAKTVDRATMLRLVAASAGDQADPSKAISVKKIEMDALAGYADIFVEILVARDSASPSGYAFRTTAKQTRDGIIVGSAAKTGRDYRYEKSFEAVSSPSGGYQLKPGSAALVLENISQELAVDLMNSMSTAWVGVPR